MISVSPSSVQSRRSGSGTQESPRPPTSFEPEGPPSRRTVQATRSVASGRERGVQTELVERAQRGDREAFGVLAGGAVDRLYAVARLILRDTDLAEDAT